MIKRNGNIIITGSDGDPRQVAANNPYSPQAERAYHPRPTIHFPGHIASSKMHKTGTAMSGGAFGAGVSGSGSVQSVAQSPLYYDYRYSTPDKFYFPRNRFVANAIWRQIYQKDACIAVATDMFAELPWSKFDLIGIDDTNIKNIYEDMFNTLNVVPKLTEYSKEYLMIGEVVLHAIFNSSKGFWDRIIPHNPDYIRAEGAGLALDQPLLWLKPTPELRKLLSSPDPRVKKLQKNLPKEIINSIRLNQDIPLDDLNTTFLARYNAPYDTRGTSIYTRLYRVVMYEDFVVNASLAIAQRNAAPLRIFKLGDPGGTGWLPDEEDEAAFAEMLSMAESDPLAAIVMHSNISCELVGVSDRVLLISKEWDFIERAKLLALGVSKAFLVGETSFAAAVAGLQTLLERLANLRYKFEQDWIIKKLCLPIAKINGFYKRPQSELDHRIRVKKQEDINLIIPSLKWSKNLDATQETSLLQVWRDLKDRGLLSDRTYASGAGLDIDIERKNQEEERKHLQSQQDVFAAQQQNAPAGGGGGGFGGAPGGKPKGFPGGVPGVPQKAPKPTGPAGMPEPIPLPGASKIKKHSSSTEEDLYNDIEDRLVDVADGSGKVDVNEVLEMIDEIKIAKSKDKELEVKFDKLEKIINQDFSSSLTGE